MEIVYGPVSSWRLGRSLGVDLICRGDKKVCTLDCNYCSLGETGEKTVERRNFVDADVAEKEIRKSLEDVEADVVTISGTGEPTLAENVGEMIRGAKRVSSLPVAVLTNSTLMDREDVRQDLSEAEIVVGSLDAPDEELFEKINKPHEDISFEKVVRGMKKFGKEFDGLFSLEIMFGPENKDFVDDFAGVAKYIGPDEVQINTPLRPCPVNPLTPEELSMVEKAFEGLKVLSVYEAEKLEVGRVVGEEKLRELKRTAQ